MVMLVSPQVAAEYGVVTAQDLAQRINALARDTKDFVGDNPLVIVGLVALAIFFFVMTRPAPN